MNDMLRELCELYTQDFDLVFQRDTDPVDLFCKQHNLQAQQELLGQLKEFYDGVLSGRNSIGDLVEMGLEYVPEGDRSLASWVPRLIKYLEGKITMSNGDGIQEGELGT
jgi:hypothetical protein